MNHSDLVTFSAAWLRRDWNVDRILVEAQRRRGENPDVWGFRTADGQTFVVECKASTSDWEADRKKPWRRADKGCGNRRWYFIHVDLPILESAHNAWGIVRCDDAGATIIEREPAFLTDPRITRNDLRFLAGCMTWPAADAKPGARPSRKRRAPSGVVALFLERIGEVVRAHGPIAVAPAIRMTGHAPPWFASGAKIRQEIVAHVAAGDIPGVVVVPGEIPTMLAIAV